MATTSSPTRRSPELPSSTVFRLLAPLILSRARSFELSAATRVASRAWLSPARLTLIDVAPATTWALVSTSPSAVRTTPVPAPWVGKNRPPREAWVWM